MPPRNSQIFSHPKTIWIVTNYGLQLRKVIDNNTDVNIVIIMLFVLPNVGHLRTKIARIFSNYDASFMIHLQYALINLI